MLLVMKIMNMENAYIGIRAIRIIIYALSFGFATFRCLGLGVVQSQFDWLKPISSLIGSKLALGKDSTGVRAIIYFTQQPANQPPLRIAAIANHNPALLTTTAHTMGASSSKQAVQRAARKLPTAADAASKATQGARLVDQTQFQPRARHEQDINQPENQPGNQPGNPTKPADITKDGMDPQYLARVIQLGAAVSQHTDNAGGATHTKNLFDQVLKQADSDKSRKTASDITNSSTEVCI